MTRRCFLRSCEDPEKRIELFDKQETTIGRCKVTQIKDIGCSRKQLSLKADFEENIVVVKQLGKNPSGLDRFILKENGTYKVEHGSVIEVLFEKYFYVIEFDPEPSNYKVPVLKRKHEMEETSPRESKCLKKDLAIKVKVEEAMEDVWEEIDQGELYIFTAKGVKASYKIAAFDMDGTLIKTKSGNVHPVDTNDWQIAFSPVSQKLKEQAAKGFKIVIMSNQAPIGKGRVKIEDFKIKIENIIKKLDVPIQVFISTGKGFYRKPTTGMWKSLAEQKNDGLEIDMNESFFCGDAAGRAANWAPGKKKDHSMADKLMAENLGIKFYTPEQYFLGHSIANVPMNNPEFVSKDLISEPFNDKLISTEKEILVFVGFPGSGKSFLAKQIKDKSANQYVSVCRDELGSWQKCAAEAKKWLKEGKSVVVDSTNPDVDSRGRWISLAKEMNVQCRCAVMAATKAHAQHNNKFRELMKINHVPVNDIVFHSYKKKFVQPTPSEGFKEVIVVKFNPHFDDEKAEKIYRMHLLEK